MRIQEIKDAMSNFSTFRARMNFCKENFDYVAGGTGRKVFDIGNGMALKLGCNRKGIDQNFVESDYGLSRMYPDLLNPTIDNCDDGHWMIVPLLEKISKKDLVNHVGMDLREMDIFLRGMEDERRGKATRINWDQIEENEVMSQVMDLVFNTTLLTGDWSRMSSWGRDPQTNSLRIIDWGLDQQVYDKHYSFNRHAALAY